MRDEPSFDCSLEPGNEASRLADETFVEDASVALPSLRTTLKTRYATLVTASAACALTVFDTNVVAVSLPSIARSFHANFADVEWVVSSYMVVFASCLLAAGGLADRFGRKKTLMVGLAIFAIASLGCGIAPTVTVLNIARATKGAGAALFLTSALAVIAHTFQDSGERARAWAFWGTCMGLATTIAPLVGGAITQWINWRWIFLLNLPVCAVLALAARRTIQDSRNPEAGPVDVVGSLLFGAALAVGIWGLIGATSAGWGRVASVERFAACAVLLIAFICVERNRRHAMVDISLFGQRKFVAAVLAMFGYASCAQVMMTFLPLYFQNAFAVSAAMAGMKMLPFALAMIVGPYIGAAGARSLSPYRVLGAGLALIGAGNIMTALAVASADSWSVALGMVVTGCGAGILNGNTQKAIMACVPENRTGMASGISTTTRFSAIAISVGVLGAVLAAKTRLAMDASAVGPQLLPASRAAAFLSHVLAGDALGGASAFPSQFRPTLVSAARASFSTGFSSALTVAGLFAIGVGLAVWLLAGRDSVEQ